MYSTINLDPFDYRHDPRAEIFAKYNPLMKD